MDNCFLFILCLLEKCRQLHSILAWQLISKMKIIYSRIVALGGAWHTKNLWLFNAKRTTAKNRCTCFVLVGQTREPLPPILHLSVPDLQRGTLFEQLVDGLETRKANMIGWFTVGPRRHNKPMTCAQSHLANRYTSSQPLRNPIIGKTLFATCTGV